MKVSLNGIFDKITKNTLHIGEKMVESRVLLNKDTLYRGKINGKQKRKFYR